MDREEMIELFCRENGVKRVKRGEKKTRLSSSDYLKHRLTYGCPHCGQGLTHKRLQNGSSFFACFDVSCPVRDEAAGQYYYVSSMNERVFSN